MPDLKSSLRSLDRVEPPDVWNDAATREPSSFDVEDHVTQSPTRRVIAAVVALLVFGAVAVYSFQTIERTPVDEVTTSSTQPAPAEVRGRWQALPEGPLAPRHDASAFWVDGRVVIIGGVDGAPCPPAANCGPLGSALRDGATFAPSTGTWSGIARSPIPIAGANGAALGGTVYLWVDRYPDSSAFLSYNVSQDRWTQLPSPPHADAPGCCRLAATDESVIAYFDSQERGVLPDLLYDPATGVWRELPLDPLTVSFDRSMVWTGNELLLLAIDVDAVVNDGAYPGYRAATLDIASGRWRRLPNSEVSGYDPSWFWSSGQAVNPTLGHVGDAGGMMTGWPYGGTLDPTTGDWSDLPPGPRSPHEYGGPSVGGGDHVVSWQGAILDVATGTWTSLPATPTNADEGAAAVWAGDRLIVWGGYAWKNTDPMNPSGALLNSGWSWLPET